MKKIWWKISDKYDWLQGIWQKKSDWQKQGRNIEYRHRSLETEKLSSQKNIDYLEKEYDEINQMDVSDDKESDEREHISKDDEEKVTEDIEVLKLGKLSSQKNMDNIEK